jgi:hypothetical protein
MKGKESVFSEVNLIMIYYNLKRLTSILDPKILKNKLKELIFPFLKKKEPFLIHLKGFEIFNYKK